MNENNRYELVNDKKKTRVKRDTAKKHIEMIVSRIIEVNDNPYYLYYIDKAVLFGSYINSDKEVLGDIDIAIYLSPRIDNDDLFEISRQRAYEHGVTDFMMALIYAREEVLRYIKNRKVSISLHDGAGADYESKQHNEEVSYIYLNRHEIIYTRN